MSTTPANRKRAANADDPFGTADDSSTYPINPNNKNNAVISPKKLPVIANISIVVIAVLACVTLIWFVASRVISLNAQVSQNTQNIEQIAQFINDKADSTAASSTSSK